MKQELHEVHNGNNYIILTFFAYTLVLKLLRIKVTIHWLVSITLWRHIDELRYISTVSRLHGLPRACTVLYESRCRDKIPAPLGIKSFDINHHKQPLY